MATVGQLQVDIGVNLKDLKRGMKQARKLVKQFEKVKATVKIDADITGVVSAVKSAKKRLNSLSQSSKVIKMDMNEKGVLSGIKSVEKRLNKLTNKKWVVKITADISGFTSAINQAQSQVNKLVNGTYSAKIKADTSNLTSAISSAQSQLNSLTGGTHTVQINANTSQAMQQVGDLQQQISDMSDGLTTAGGVMTAGITLPAVALGYSSIQTATDQQKMQSKMQGGLGISSEEAKVLTDQSKNVWTSGVGDSLEAVNEALRITKTNLRDLNGADLSSITQGALNLEDIFGGDVNQATRTASTMMKNFGGDGKEAMDLITVAFQKGGNYYDDLLDTMNEYSVFFDEMGMSAKEMTNILIQGAQKGAWNLDKVGDSVAEFGKLALEGSESTREGFQGIGLDADMMASNIAKGGDTAKQAFMATVAGLANMKDEVEQNQLGVKLFGTTWEDLRENVIGSLNPAIDVLGKTEGALDDLNKTMENDTIKSLRELSLSFTELKKSIGETLAPILQRVADVLKKVVDWFNNLSPGLKNFILIAIAVVSVVAPLLLIFGLLVGAIIGVVGAILTAIPTIIAIGSVLAGLSIPILIIIAVIVAVIGIFVAFGMAIVALIGYLIYLYQTNEEVASYINQIWKEKIVPLIAIAKNVFSTIVAIVMFWMSVLKDFILAMLALIAGDWDGYWKYIGEVTDAWTTYMKSIVASFAIAVYNSFVELLNNLVQSSVDGINNVLKAWHDLAKAHPGVVAFANVIIQIFGKLGLKVINIVETMINGVVDMFTSLGSIVDSKINGFIDSYNNGIGKITGKSIDTKFTLGTDFANSIPDMVKGAKGMLSDMAGGDFLSVPSSGSKPYQIQAPDLLKYKLKSTDSGSKPKKPDWMQEGKSWLDDHLKALDDAMKKAEEIIKNGGDGGEPDWIKEARQKAKDAGKAVDGAKGAKKAVDDVGKSANGTATEIDQMAQAVDSLASGLKSMSDGFNQSIGIFDRFSRKFTSMSTLLRNGKQRNLAYQEWTMLQSQLGQRQELSNESRYAVSQLDVTNLAELRALATSNPDELSQWSGYNTNVQRLSEKQAVQSLQVENIYIDAKDKDYKTIAEMLYKEMKRRGDI